MNMHNGEKTVSPVPPNTRLPVRHSGYSDKIFSNLTLFFTIVMVGILVALVFVLRLINLQVLMASHYREIAEKNRTQIIAQAAPRGRISIFLRAETIPQSIPLPGVNTLTRRQ